MNLVRRIRGRRKVGEVGLDSGLGLTFERVFSPRIRSHFFRGDILVDSRTKFEGTPSDQGYLGSWSELQGVGDLMLLIGCSRTLLQVRKL